jgi:predicted HNH restriction endonuclease
MFESEITLGLLIVAWILYELYGSLLGTWISVWSPYIRIAGGVAGILFLWFVIRETPDSLELTMSLAKQLMKDGSAAYTSSTTRDKRSVTGAMKKIVGAKYEWKCAGCKSLLDEGYQVDHIIPLFKNGTNDIDNLQPLCGTCHNKKSIRERVL